MKRVLLFSLLFVCGALPALAVRQPGQLPRTANTFAPLRDYAGGELKSPKVNQKYLMPKMMRGETIRVSLDMGKLSYLSEEDIRQLIARSYEKWFLQAAEHIRHSKRASEFKDVLPILDKGVRVEFVKENPDIAFYFVPLAQIREGKPKDATTLAYYKKDGVAVPSIFVPADWADQKGNSKKPKKLAKFYAALLIHEIGHSIGFADSYEDGRLSADQLYGTANIYPSVMDSMHDYYKEENLSCDDATGVINLMDITRNYTQRGGEKGWHSLCSKSKEYFVHNVSPFRKSYKVEYGDKKEVLVAGFDDNGRPFSRKYPFAKKFYSPLEGVAVQGDKFDSLNRMIHGYTTRGEEVFINYLYESRTLVVLRHGEVVYYRQDKYPFPNKNKSLWIIQPEGRMQLWILEKNNKSRQLEVYTWSSDDTSLTKVERKYDKKGRFLEEIRSEQGKKPNPQESTVTAQKSAAGKSSDMPSVMEQQVKAKASSAQVDQFVKEFKIDTKSKGKELVF